MNIANRWLHVVGGILMNLSLGSIYGWSLYVPALQKDLNLTRTQTSDIFSVTVVFFAVFFLIAGRLQDKKGPYVVSLIGSVLFGTGFLLASRATTLWEMYFAFGLIVGAGAGFGYVTPIGVATKWFPDRRGLVVGISVGAMGAGSAILGPIVPGLISRFGWQSVMFWQGLIYFVATMAGAQLLKNPPPGYTPPGWKPSAVSPSRASGVEYSPSEILRTSHFYRLLVAFALGISAGLMVISQLLPYAQQAIPGMGAALAGTAVTVGAIGNAAGRIFSGWLSDSIGRVKTISIMVLFSAVTLPFLGRIHSIWLLWPLLFIVYYCYGTQLSLYPTTTADFFGAKNVGANYGFVYLAFGVAGVVGPRLGGRVYDQFQSYTWAFDIAAGLLLAAFAVIVTLRPPAQKAQATP